MVPTEIRENHRFCDICGVEIPIGLACTAATCQICGKDICENCIGNEEDAGDWRDVQCTLCWSIGQKYLPEIAKMKSKVTELYQKWYAECGSETT